MADMQESDNTLSCTFSPPNVYLKSQPGTIRTYSDIYAGML